MSVRISLNSLAITLISLFAFYLVFGWLALPRIIQSQAEKYITERTGRHLTLDRPKFNPFTLDLRVANLKLAEQDDKPLFSFRDLDVNLSISSLIRLAVVFDQISLDGAEADVILRRDNKLNWSVLLDALHEDNEQEQADSQKALPRLYIQRFVLSDGGLNFVDENTGFSPRFKPLALELSDISTLPDDQGSYKIEAHTPNGARILWQGRMALTPLEIKGSLEVDSVHLDQLAPYLKDLLPVASPRGVLALSTDYRVAYEVNRFNLTLDNAASRVDNLGLDVTKRPGFGIAVDTIELSRMHYDLTGNTLVLGALAVKGSEITVSRGRTTPLSLVRLGEFALEDVRMNLAKQDIKLSRVALGDGELKLVRYANGHVNVLDLLHDATSTEPAKPKENHGNTDDPWHYHIDKFESRDLSVAFRDESVTPNADLMVKEISVDVTGISDNLANPLPIEASLLSRDGGKLTVSGKLVPSIPSADLQVRLAGLSLKPVQPYLAAVAKLTLADGRLNFDGRAGYGKNGGKFRGGFEFRNLLLTETESNDTFLAWKSMVSRDLIATQNSMDIGELRIDGLESKLIIYQDKSVNLTRIMHKAEVPAEAPDDAGQEAIPDKSKDDTASDFLVNIDRVKISNGAMNYADYSLLLPFGTSIHALNGSLVGLSSRPGVAGQIELDGQVDDYGIARALGQIDLFNPANLTDVKVVFRNVEMVRLTPYSSTFAGRDIVSGKLSLDLEYKIKNRQLEGNNQITMDKLTLGKRVDSPSALDLPLDFAIAILEDSEGRIDLGLPVSGSLDDPKFSYGGIIWKAFVNIIGNIVTAPFRALGALFGGNEKFENISFEFGKQKLSPPEQEKVVHLADALSKRPKLSLTLHGVYAEADRVALQDLQLRRSVAKLSGQHLEDREDPGPLSTGSKKVQGALEDLYSKSIGTSELSALKEAYRKANPGMLQEGVGEKMMSLISGIFHEKRELNTDEVNQLKGTDFYAVLFQRLRDRETVTDTQLQDLAKSRGDNTVAALQAAGLGPERMQLAAPEKVEAGTHDVPLKIGLVAGTATNPPAANQPGD